MERVVLDHYPASKLPDDLRGGILPSASVKITVEEIQAAPDRERLLSLLRKSRGAIPTVTLEEAVRRVRELRDEWD